MIEQDATITPGWYWIERPVSKTSTAARLLIDIVTTRTIGRMYCRGERVDDLLKKGWRFQRVAAPREVQP